MKKRLSFAHQWSRLRASERGSVLIELSVIAPVIMLLVMGGFEVSRYALLHQKLHRLAVSVADLASQAKQLSAADVDDLFNAVQYIARPFDVSQSSVVILTSVSRSEDTVRVNWQSDSGNYSASSQVGSPGSSATLPSGFALRDGETVIVAEVYYSYTPMLFSGLIAGRELYQVSLFRPRLGTLDQLT